MTVLKRCAGLLCVIVGVWKKKYAPEWQTNANPHSACAATSAMSYSMLTRGKQVDTGVDLQHPDILPSLWMNPIEMAGPGATLENGYENGIDDDSNGERLFQCPHTSTTV